MRRFVLVVILTATCLTALAACGSSTQPIGEQSRQKQAVPTGTPLQPVGIPALQVRPNETQPFTIDDVSAYFKTHILPGTYATTPITVISLEFITSREVSARLQGETTGFPDTHVLGFAVLEGDFVFSSPPQAPTYHAKQAYAAFDALTGNLVMDGIYTVQ